jgi:hypothetical protein
MGVGTWEPERCRTSIREARDALPSAQVRQWYFKLQGAAPGGQTWRRDLRDLSPRPFRFKSATPWLGRNAFNQQAPPLRRVTPVRL